MAAKIAFTIEFSPRNMKDKIKDCRNLMDLIYNLLENKLFICIFLTIYTHGRKFSESQDLAGFQLPETKF